MAGSRREYENVRRKIRNAYKIVNILMNEFIYFLFNEVIK